MEILIFSNLLRHNFLPNKTFSDAQRTFDSPLRKTPKEDSNQGSFRLYYSKRKPVTEPGSEFNGLQYYCAACRGPSADKRNSHPALTDVPDPPSPASMSSSASPPQIHIISLFLAQWMLWLRICLCHTGFSSHS